MLLTPKVHNVDELRESGERVLERERAWQRVQKPRESKSRGIIDVSFVRGVGHEELQPWHDILDPRSRSEPEPDGPDRDAAGSIRGRAG